MNALETGEVLALMAHYDNRNVGETDIVAWLKVVGDLPFGDCLDAVVAHYKESRERIMPVDIRDRVKAIRLARLQETPLSGRPPADPQEYAAWLGSERKRIADGQPAPRALENPR